MTTFRDSRSPRCLCCLLSPAQVAMSGSGAATQARRWSWAAARRTPEWLFQPRL